MISNTAEYALRAIVFLASSPNTQATAQHIAEQTQVPAGYLSKIMQDLAKAGVVTSQRGPRGGFTLARPPEEVTVLEVVNAVDPVQRIRTCPLKIASHGTNLCPLHRRLDDALASVEAAFAASSIAEMLDTPTNRAARKCSFPVAPAPKGTTPLRVRR